MVRVGRSIKLAMRLGTLILTALGLAILPSCSRTSMETWPEVAPVNLSTLTPADFSNDELDIPYYLFHFHQLANSVVSTGPERGFIALPVWRAEKDNKPYNARIMENILSLTWFYTADRPWNPYRGDTAVRARLEAALEFWCGIQSEDGRFSEYGEQKWNLAATAFATKFMGETLQLLAVGPEIDRAIHDRAIESMRKAIFIVLTDGEFWRHGISYSNQYSNVWAGALAYLDLFPDEEIKTLLASKVNESMEAFQSPAGYFYEKDGPDWGYNLGTHHSNLQVAWHYARGTELEPLILRKMEKWYDWFSYNAAWEPDLSGYYLNRAIETRQQKAWAGARERTSNRSNVPQAEFIPVARAFTESTAERAIRIEQERAELAASWPNIRPLTTGEFNAYTPYVFLHRRMYEWQPSPEQKTAAMALLPYNGRRSFIHQFHDSRKDVTYTYVRKPGYYACFNSGEKIVDQQRYGLGLLRHPRIGAVLQSQTATPDRYWGTAPEGRTTAYETESFFPKFYFDGETSNFKVSPGKNTLRSTRPLTIQYNLAGAGTKDIWFMDDAIEVIINHKAPFEERLPLLVDPEIELREQAGGLNITTKRGRINLKCSSRAKPVIERTGEKIGPKELVMVKLRGMGRLSYTFSFR